LFGPVSIPLFGSLVLIGNYTLWTHFNALDVARPLDPPTCPLPPTYTSPNELRYTGIAVADQLLCVLVNFFVRVLNSPARAHTMHFLVQLPAITLPFTVERTRDGASIFISQALLGTAYQIKGAGVIAPLGYLLTIWLTASVRDPHPARGTAPLTQPQAESILVAFLLGFAFPTAMMFATMNPYWIALWQVNPWLISATQSLYLLAVPRSAPASTPGSGQALFKSTLYTLSTVGAIAHWAFLYHVFTAPTFSLAALLTFSWLPSLSIPPHDIGLADAFAHFLEWDAIMAYTTTFLGGLWLLDLAQTKRTNAQEWVRDTLRRLLVGVVAGPAAMLYTIWGEREDALVRASKAEEENE
jgi:hypothetical protein